MITTSTKSFALYGTSACSAPNCCKNWCAQSMQPVWRTKSEVSWHRECEGADTSYLVVSLYLRRYLGCTPELTVWLGWSEHHGKICMCTVCFVMQEYLLDHQCLCSLTRFFFIQGICMMILVLQVVHMPNIKV